MKMKMNWECLEKGSLQYVLVDVMSLDQLPPSDDLILQRSGPTAGTKAPKNAAPQGGSARKRAKLSMFSVLGLLPLGAFHLMQPIAMKSRLGLHF